MQISNYSVASLFQELQALAGGATSGAGFANQLTGQNLPMSTTQSATSSIGAAALSTSSPGSQFAQSMLSALLTAQEAPPTPQTLASNIISAINPNGDSSLSLGQVEQALTGSPASTSPQQLGIANAFAKLDTNGDGQLSSDELANALQTLQANDPFAGLGHRHHHHHHVEAQTASADATSSSSTTSASGSSTDSAASDTSGSVANTGAAATG